MKSRVLFFAVGLVTSLLSLPLHAATTSLVNHGDQWQYHKGTNQPQSDWKAVAASLDGTWLSGLGGFGYGSDAAETNNCKTILPDMRGSAATNYTTLYMRQTFTITNAVATNLHLFLRMDWDDGYIAWLDGNYLTNSNVTGAPTEPARTATANASHECSTGQTGNPAVTNDLGLVGSRLGLGDHVLAIIGLNQTATSGDFIQVADLFLDAVAEPPVVTNGVGGTLAVDTTWYATNAFYTVTSSITVLSNVTLTIEPGVSVRFRLGLGMTVNGRVLADGTTNQPITFTRYPGDASWARIKFVGAADSRLRNCVIEYASCAGDHQDYYPTVCDPPQYAARNYHEAIVVLACHLDLEGCLFRNLLGGSGGNEGDALAIISDDAQVPGAASASIRACRFDGIGQGVHTRYSYVLVQDCYFVNKHGDNDDVDLYGESMPPPLILNNMFAAPCHEDRINPTKCSAILIGNVIAVSDDHGIVLRDRGFPVLINNLVYNCANGGISVQNTCDALIVNNTIVNSGRAFRFFDHFDRHVPPYCLTPGSGRATIVNCIVWNCPQSFLLTDSTNGHSYANVSYCDIQGGQASASVSANSTFVWGPGNLNVNPQFIHITNNQRLALGSPCIDAGTNLSAIVTNDFDGLPRPLDGDGANGPAHDMGAYEFFLATADSNGDGLPDGWCQQYGFNPVATNTATNDADLDGLNNSGEYVADTNPTNALSFFHVEAISSVLPATVLFASSTNRQYTLFYCTNLASGNWTAVPGQQNIRATNGVTALTDANAAPEKFYRVEVSVP